MSMFRRFRRTITESAAAPALEAVRGDLVPITETAVRSDGTVPLRLISPGQGSSGYYSADVLEQAAHDRVFPAGTHMYIDHPTLTERADRPERSIRDLAAVLETDAIWQAAHPDGPGLYAQARVFAPYRPIIAEMADHIGVSIRASAEMSRGQVDGRRVPIIDRLIEAQSVDFVTRPGRGGAVLSILESAQLGEAMVDDVRQWLRDALRSRFADGEDQWVWVRDFDLDDGLVIFDLEGDDIDTPGTYQLPFTQTDDSVTLSDEEPTRVQVTTSYEPVGEARNVAEWFQSRIHLHFTQVADDMFGEGRLTKEERLTLSSGIGAALDAFSALVDDQAPQLLTRDLWDEPRPSETSIDESQEDTDMTPKEIQEAVAAGIAEAIKPVNDRLDKIEESKAAEAEEVQETDKVRADRAEELLLVREAADHIAGLDKVKALPAVTAARLVESVSKGAQRTDDGKLDTKALDEATTTAVEAEAKYLAEATGSPVRGVGTGAGGGSGDTPDVDALEARRVERYKRWGLTEEGAKTAVAGRR